MKIGYLMNSYPMTSTTFIRREIESLESLGIEIKRYAVRHWSEELVDELDIAEQSQTQYLLTNNAFGLLKAFFIVLFANATGLFHALILWRKVCKNAGGITIKHIAYLLQATYFYRQSRRDGIQHVHTHFATNATTVAMLAREMGGVSYSFTSHGPDEFVDPQFISMALKIHHAAFVVAISNFCRAQLIRFSSPTYLDKIIIVHCGLNVDEFIPNYDFNNDNQNLICVGRLCPQKGQLLIPQALALLKPDFPHLKIHLIGDGESRNALEEEIIKYHVADLIELHGWKANLEVRKMISECRSFLLPSFAEGLPVVIMESLALGRPVISTYIAGIPELVDKKCGWLVPAGSVEDISNAIREALTATPAQLSAMGREGHARVAQEHNLKLISQQLYSKFLSINLS